MTEINGENSSLKISTPGKIIREILPPFFPPIPSDEIKGKENLPHIEKLINEGYSIVVLYNHFSSSDIFRTLEFVLKQKSMKNKEICVPIIEDLYNYTKLIPKAAKIKFCSIVTQKEIDILDRKHKKQYGKSEKSSHTTLDSLSRLKEKQMRERDKLVEQQKPLNSLYFKTALDTLRKGGIIIVAPQVTRDDSLKIPTEDSPTAVSTLIARLDHDKLDKVAFLPIGLGIKNQTDYSEDKVGLYNLGKKYILHIGPIFTKNELRHLALERYAEIQIEQKKTRRGVERVVIEELAKLVPPEYLKSLPQQEQIRN